jgi:ankyrin repeat protein
MNLHAAARRNHVKVGQLLVEHGVQVHALGKWEWTPLHIESVHGHLEIGQLLLEHGADVNAKDNEHGTQS